MVDCERCERGFPHQSAYLQHIRDSRSHNICDDCDKDYLHEIDLIQHYKGSSCHHYCADCDTHFDDEDELIHHYRTANGHAYCGWCDKVLKGQRGLDDHNKSCHYCCRKCGRCFRTENELRHHLKSKTHRKADIPCRCGRYFISTAAWILHFEQGFCPIVPNVDRYLVKQHVGEIELCGRGRGLLVTESSDYENGIYRCPDPSCTKQFGALFQHIESESCNAREDQALKLLAKVDRRIYGA
ncbi:hypothetical protein M404DRAFT_1009455 [Pisolithus tinctorius Marx 270]|uniref:C2H2-type domain-containing protein n=1 Tax=Pisolithus tinctorius Marx 270 TaxID=870435 RepID=A0A0C3NAN2_PISTI|nr:hypothetical protein M404DRAFT_1009455 [Pisolithus tinctorius Marx 270]